MISTPAKDCLLPLYNLQLTTPVIRESRHGPTPSNPQYRNLRLHNHRRHRPTTNTPYVAHRERGAREITRLERPFLCCGAEHADLGRELGDGLALHVADDGNDEACGRVNCYPEVMAGVAGQARLFGVRRRVQGRVEEWVVQHGLRDGFEDEGEGRQRGGCGPPAVQAVAERGQWAQTCGCGVQEMGDA